jgi:hypothetical protein
VPNVALNHDATDDALLQLSPGEDEPQEDEPQEEEHQEFEEENIALNEANIPTPSASSSVETDTKSQAGIHTCGQIAAYAGVGLSMSFRNHFFSMLILGPYARFIRWDRRGAVFTRRFDYTKNPFHIFNFYLRYGQLTLLQRGFDPTVEQHQPPNSARRAYENYPQSSWHGGAKLTHCILRYVSQIIIDHQS